MEKSSFLEAVAVAEERQRRQQRVLDQVRC
jgi:hypothetical protein